MKSIDRSVPAYYDAGRELYRLRTGIGRIEFERTKEILLATLPKAPAVIFDIGGAYGEYSWWLASLGYEVHLFDLSKTNIEMSELLKDEYPGCSLESAEVCDATLAVQWLGFSTFIARAQVQFLVGKCIRFLARM